MKIPRNNYIIFERDDYYNCYCRDNKCIEVDKYFFAFGENINYHLIKKENKFCLFIGDLYLPSVPEYSNEKVIEKLSCNLNFDNIYNSTYEVFGKWIVVYIEDGYLKIFGDPSHMIPIFYSEKETIISSLPKLINYCVKEDDIMELDDNNDKRVFFDKYYKETNWWCGTATYYNNIRALLPNHIMFINKNLSKEIYRKIISRDITHKMNVNKNYPYERSIELLSGFLKSISLRKNIALTVTGGKDSRILLGLCNKYIDNCEYFIDAMNDAENKENSNFMNKIISKLLSSGHVGDVLVAEKLASKLGLELNMLNMDVDEKKEALIKENLPDVNYGFSKIIYSRKIETTDTIVKGLIPEIFSCYYYNRIDKYDAKNIAFLAGHGGSNFAEMEYEKWLFSLNNSSFPKGYELLDLFYWEQRAGRWGSQWVSICDLFEDTVWGFNCREFYDIWMQTPRDLRIHPKKENLIILANMIDDRFVNIKYDEGGFLKKTVFKLMENPKICLIMRKIYYKLK